MQRLIPLGLAFLLVFGALVLPEAALAQGVDEAALITAVDTSAFPDMRVYLSVSDAAHHRLAGLPADAFTLTENTSPVTGLTVSEKEVGVQVVFVLDPTAAFKTRDANGVTRLDFLKQALTDYARTTPWMKDDVDDVTVLAPEGALVEHSRAGGEVAHAVMSYTTAFTGAADPFPLVNRALDFASDATARPGMRRYVVFISGGLAPASVNDLAARAAAAQISVYTVFVGPAGADNTVGAQGLRQLAELTGGAYAFFEKPGTLAPLFQYLADQRHQYLLTYRSTLAVTGQHTLVAQVKLPGGPALASNTSVFPLRIEPPVITLPGVPTSLQRVVRGREANPQITEPAAYEVPIKVDFPDGHPRGLSRAELVVDGQPVAAQPTDKVETLTWPLANYASGTYTLQARITDELGLAAESEAVTVTLTLEISPATVASKPETKRALPVTFLALLLIAVLITAAGLVVAGWLWFARRDLALKPKVPVAAAPAPRLAGTQPSAPGAKTRPSPRIHMPPLHLPKRAVPLKPQGKAYLEVLEPGGGGAPREDIEILDPLLRLGRDASLAEIVFPDRSVSHLHARIAEAPEGVFHIFDQGSTSGTWVNFTQIPAETGWKLQPGDVINLGRVRLRFQRRDV